MLERPSEQALDCTETAIVPAMGPREQPAKSRHARNSAIRCFHDGQRDCMSQVNERGAHARVYPLSVYEPPSLHHVLSGFSTIPHVRTSTPLPEKPCNVRCPVLPLLSAQVVCP
jgi:hypothetical protein